MCCEPLPFGQLRGTEPHSQTRVRSTPVHVNMSQYVARATGVAKQAAEVFSKRVVPPAVDYYNATMARNAEYVVKDPAAVDKLGRQLVFSNLAKLPGMVEGARAEVNIVKQKWAGRMDLPMAEVRTDLTRIHPPRSASNPFFCPHRSPHPRRNHRPIPRDVRPRTLPSLVPGWNRGALRGRGLRLVLRRGDHRPRRLPHRLLGPARPPDHLGLRTPGRIVSHRGLFTFFSCNSYFIILSRRVGTYPPTYSNPGGATPGG